MKYSIYECTDCDTHRVVGDWPSEECPHCHSHKYKEICGFEDILPLVDLLLGLLAYPLEHLKESSLELEWMGSCTNCGIGEAADEYHSCPHAEAASGDSSDRCNCCTACVDDCADNI